MDLLRQVPNGTHGFCYVRSSYGIGSALEYSIIGTNFNENRGINSHRRPKMPRTFQM